MKQLCLPLQLVSMPTPNMGLNEVRFAYILNQKNLKKAMSIFKSGLSAI